MLYQLLENICVWFHLLSRDEKLMCMFAMIPVSFVFIYPAGVFFRRNNGGKETPAHIALHAGSARIVLLFTLAFGCTLLALMYAVEWMSWTSPDAKLAYEMSKGQGIAMRDISFHEQMRMVPQYFLLLDSIGVIAGVAGFFSVHRSRQG
ncbi:MAG: hypothetical protein H6815_05585 [Phycisphaeraceae bacterium]|nr:hypothetical protein [Phycisphaerales bacterium]MCB9859910.1 hypothetical protein [Phycisphaeraceae bacterium]